MISNELTQGLLWAALSQSGEIPLKEHDEGAKELDGTRRDGGQRDGHKVKIIMVTTETPGLGGGASVRNHHMVRQLVRQGFEVRLLCVGDQPAAEEEWRLARELGVWARVLPLSRLSVARLLKAVALERVPPYMAVYRASGLAGALAQMVTEYRPQVVQLEQLDAYYAVEEVVKGLKDQGVRVVLDAHNVEGAAFRQSLEGFDGIKRLAGEWVAPGLELREREAAESMDAIIACSQSDVQVFRQWCGQVTVAANGVDVAWLDGLDHSFTEPEILFMGSMSYPHNEDALRWFLRQIYPDIKRVLPGARLTVLGGAPPAWLQEIMARDTSIEAPGLVPDVRPYLARAGVCVCPIRLGSGARLKVLEYMGAGKAVVSTAKGCEGIECTPGRELLVANDAPLFAQDVVAALRDPILNDNLGRAARSLALEYYDWNVIGQSVKRTYQGLLGMAAE